MSRFLDGIFEAKIALRGGMVRRGIKGLKENDCYEKLLSMARDRCFPVFAMVIRSSWSARLHPTSADLRSVGRT